MLDELDPDVVPRQQGEHVCVFYRSNGERDRLMAAYLRDGLQIGHTCLGVAGAPESAATASTSSTRAAWCTGRGAAFIARPRSPIRAAGSRRPWSSDRSSAAVAR